MNRVQAVKIILWALTGLATAVGVTRFVFGLGATTNLSDATPWGLWIGFDVMAGVALAAGGFVMTAIFYVFKREEFRPLVKPAVLTAFLGYLAVIFGLLFDLGLPWNIWHMMIYWNPHSPLFEVGWCVMLYTTVLLLEFSPVPLEETSRYAKVRSFLLRFRFPLVLLGVMLSTLHQSSLGSLFLIMPYKLHPLWYSSIIPVQFFISAVALGLSIVALESLISHWLYRRHSEPGLIARLAKASVWVLTIYFIVRMIDIAATGKLGLVFSGDWEANLFILEMLMSVLVPVALFSIPRVRASAGAQWSGSFLVVVGIVFNRINVGGLTMLSATGDHYLPSWMEIAISLGVVSLAALAFLFAIERFHIWDKRPRHPEADPYAQPEFDYSARVWLGAPAVAAPTKYSLVFVLSFALGFAFLPEQKIEGRGVDLAPVLKARGGDTLFIDGNHDSFGTSFDHTKHIDSLGQKDSCVKCHHLNKPLDRESGCWECHRFMYVTTDVFNHDWHSNSHGAKLGCSVCHEEGKPREKATAKNCKDCHTDLFIGGSTITVDSFQAPSYVDAMHQQCVGCHKDRADADTTRTALGQCPTCHSSSPTDYLRQEVKQSLVPTRQVPVMLPFQEARDPEEQRSDYGQ